MQKLVIGAIYFLYFPSVISCIDGSELSNEEFLNRSVLACPVGLSEDGKTVTVSRFSFSSRSFSQTIDPVHLYEDRKVITSEMLAELNEWSVKKDWNLTFDANFFVEHAADCVVK